jgi:hypothetical protein
MKEARNDVAETCINACEIAQQPSTKLERAEVKQ